MKSIDLNCYEVLSWSLQQVWMQYHNCVSECCRNPKVKPVHKLRTSLRRLASLLELLQEIRFSKEIKKLRAEFKLILSSLGKLRDYQNQEKLLKQQLKPSVLLNFRKSLKEKIKVEKKNLRKTLSSIRSNRQALSIQRLTEELVTLSDRSGVGKKVNNNLKMILTSKFHQFERCALHAKASDATSIHKTRIEFKKYRYACEALQDIFGQGKSTENAMKKLQNLLGEIQDLFVLKQLLIEFVVDQRDRHPDPEFFEFYRATEKKFDEAIAKFFAIRKQFLLLVQPEFTGAIQQAA